MIVKTSDAEAVPSGYNSDMKRFRNDGFWLCCAGVALLAVSLFLPVAGVGGAPGWMALLFGRFWYPTNITLALSPIIYWSDSHATRRLSGEFLLVSGLLTPLIAMPFGEPFWLIREPRSGFWVWLTALIASGIGLLSRQSESPIYKKFK